MDPKKRAETLESPEIGTRAGPSGSRASGSGASTSSSCPHGSRPDAPLQKPTGKTPAKKKVAQAILCLTTERAKRAAKRAAIEAAKAEGAGTSGLLKPRPARKANASRRKSRALPTESGSPTPPPSEEPEREPRSPTPPREEEPRSPTPPPPFKGKGKGQGKVSKKAGMFLD